MKIFKYEINVDLPINLPVGAEILCVKTQRGIPCLWAVVDPLALVEQKNIYVVGTGHEMPKAICRYIDTFFIGDKRRRRALSWFQIHVH